MKKYTATINIAINTKADHKKAETILENFFDKLEETQTKEIEWYVDYYEEVEKHEL